MKIAMMGAWNTDSGASIHAELVGREWVKKGIDLKVFSFYRHSFHGTVITKTPEEEEEYVKRCFTVHYESGIPETELDAKPILETDYDIFVAQDIGMLPLKQLLEIFPRIKKKARTINVVHDGTISKRPEFFQLDWDKVVCFDDRYFDFLKEKYPEDKLHIIPYPCSELKRGNKEEARKKLDLPKEKKIVFLFGMMAECGEDITFSLDTLADKYDIMLLLCTKSERALKTFRRIQPKLRIDLNIIEEAPSMDKLYEYLYASDCLVYPKTSKPSVVIASTISQCMGSGCPVIALDSNFVYPLNDEVIKYRDSHEFTEGIIDIFEKGEKYKTQQKAIEEYLKDNSGAAVAEKFIKLFDEMLSK
ncbi:MAG: hypothetical protein ABH862_03025 [Candidatus Omnitrophota bacterium]